MPSKPVSSNTRRKPTARHRVARCAVRQRGARRLRRRGGEQPQRGAGARADSTPRRSAPSPRGRTAARARTPSRARRATRRTCWPRRATRPKRAAAARTTSARSIAGSVAPIATVAGSSTRNVPAERREPMQNRRRLRADDGEQPPADGLQQHGEQQAPARRSAPRSRHTSGRDARSPRCAVRARTRRARARRRTRATTASTAAASCPSQMRALLRPDDLIAEPGEAGRRHQREREPALRSAATASLSH